MLKQKQIEKLGFMSVLLIGSNYLIGTGMYYLPADLYKIFDVYSFYFLLSGGVLVFIIALIFAELSSFFTKSGGLYVYISEAFGLFWGFQIGILRFIVACLALAVQATTFPKMLSLWYPQIGASGFEPAMISILFLLGLIIINLVSVKFVDIFIKIMGYSLLLSLFISIFIGFFGVDMANFTFPKEGIKSLNLNISTLSSGFLIVFFAFVGFENIGISTNDMKNPKKDIPKATVIALAIHMTMFFLFLFVSIGTLGHNITNPSMFNSNSLAASVGAVLGHKAEIAVLLSCFVALFATGIVATFVVPRILFPVAEDYFIPQSIGGRNKRGIPSKAIIIMGLIGMFFILLATLLSKNIFLFLLKVSVVTRLLEYIFTCLSIFNIRKKYGKGAFALPMIGFFCFIIVAFSLAIIVSTSVKVLILSVFISLGILGMYFLYSAPRRKKLLALEKA